MTKVDRSLRKVEVEIQKRRETENFFCYRDNYPQRYLLKNLNIILFLPYFFAQLITDFGKQEFFLKFFLLARHFCI